jgi:hypothetical protein
VRAHGGTKLVARRPAGGGLIRALLRYCALLTERGLLERINLFFVGLDLPNSFHTFCTSSFRSRMDLGNPVQEERPKIVRSRVTNVDGSAGLFLVST